MDMLYRGISSIQGSLSQSLFDFQVPFSESLKPGEQTGNKESKSIQDDLESGDRESRWWIEVCGYKVRWWVWIKKRDTFFSGLALQSKNNFSRSRTLFISIIGTCLCLAASVHGLWVAN